MEWRPSRLFIDSTIAGDPLALRISRNLPASEKILIDDAETLVMEDDPGPSALVLLRHDGAFVRDFVIPEGAPPCGEKYITAFAGCPFGCTYCYLPPRLPRRAAAVMIGTERMRSEVEAAARSGSFRLTTGETADSLVLDRVTGLTSDLLPLFEGTASVLEVRTKTALIDHLPGISGGDGPHALAAREHLEITWSLAPAHTAGAEERGAPPVGERLAALSRAAAAGLATGIRLDPIIPFYWDPGKYRALIEEIRDAAGDARPPRVELGVLRFPAGLIDHIRRTHPFSPLLRGEYVRCPDGKTRLYRPARVRIYRDVAEMVRRYLPGAPVELSMEDISVWEDAGVEPPAAGPAGAR